MEKSIIHYQVEKYHLQQIELVEEVKIGLGYSLQTDIIIAEKQKIK